MSTEEFMSSINNQFDPATSHAAIEQSFASKYEKDAEQSACRDANPLDEDDVKRLHKENARIKADMEKSQILILRNEERIRALQSPSGPRKALTSAGYLGEHQCMDVDDFNDTNEIYTPGYTVYANSMMATTALDAMLVDFDDLLTS